MIFFTVAFFADDCLGLAALFEVVVFFTDDFFEDAADFLETFCEESFLAEVFLAGVFFDDDVLFCVAVVTGDELSCFPNNLDNNFLNTITVWTVLLIYNSSASTSSTRHFAASFEVILLISFEGFTSTISHR